MPFLDVRLSASLITFELRAKHCEFVLFPAIVLPLIFHRDVYNKQNIT